MTGLFEQLRFHARQRPDAPALVHRHAGGRTIVTSYAALAATAEVFAAAFSGFPESAAIIPLLLPKSADCVAAMFGALGAGRAFACLNRKLRGPQVDHVLRAAAAPFALIDAASLAALGQDAEAASMLTRVRWRIVGDDAIASHQRKSIERLIAAGGQVEAWRADSALHHPGVVDVDKPGCCLFTSGSTGVPKGVLISQADLAARAAAEIELFELSTSDALLCVLPFSFDVGLNQLLSGIAAGARVVLSDSWLPADMLRAAADCRVSGISAVPSIWLDMLNAGAAFDMRDAHAALRYTTISGGDLPPDVLARLSSVAPGVGIFKTYGQSETFRSTALRPREFAERQQSVGRPFASARVYVVRDDFTPAAPGEEGEVVHTGLGTMLGYLGADGSDCLRPNPFRGAADTNAMAVFTGDVGFFDSAGYLHLRGRRDSMLKVNGNRLYPQEVAAQLLQLPDVREAEVFGVKGPDGQTRLVAFAITGPGLDGANLRRLAAARLPSYMVPQWIVPMTQMPRTASGKTDRPALMQRAIELLQT